MSREICFLGVRNDANRRTLRLAVDRIETKVNQTDWQKVFSWVCPVTHLQTQDTLQDLLSRRHTGTGTWLVESKEFRNWVNDQSEELLWITGLRKLSIILYLELFKGNNILTSGGWQIRSMVSCDGYG